MMVLRRPIRHETLCSSMLYGLNNNQAKELRCWISLRYYGVAYVELDMMILSMRTAPLVVVVDVSFIDQNNRHGITAWAKFPPRAHMIREVI